MSAHSATAGTTSSKTTRRSPGASPEAADIVAEVFVLTEMTVPDCTRTLQPAFRTSDVNYEVRVNFHEYENIILRIKIEISLDDSGNALDESPRNRIGRGIAAEIARLSNGLTRRFDTSRQMSRDISPFQFLVLEWDAPYGPGEGTGAA